DKRDQERSSRHVIERPAAEDTPGAGWVLGRDRRGHHWLPRNFDVSESIVGGCSAADGSNLTTLTSPRAPEARQASRMLRTRLQISSGSPPMVGPSGPSSYFSPDGRASRMVATICSYGLSGV